MKKAFIIRGFRFGYSAADPNFEDVRKVVLDAGFTPIPVPWTWNHKTMSQYVDKFRQFYEENKGTENIIIGHSFGAVAAFTAASHSKPDALILCSLSAYFKEDLPKYTDSDWIYRHMGKRRRDDFETLSAKQIAKDISKLNIKVHMLVGEQEKQEFPRLYDRVLQTAKDIAPERLVIIPGADHTIHAASYLRTLSDSLSLLY